MNDIKPLNVLAVEPYDGGSHRAFLQGIAKHSRHHWRVIGAPARHWKWRMRCSPIALATDAIAASADFVPDVIFCSDMLDLPCWLGLVSRSRSEHATKLLAAPVVTYFHENQWTYPQSPSASPDFHYGYTNLLTAIASDACWFNSEFHLTSFFDACRSFIKRMPDSRSQHDLVSAKEKSIVIPPGFEVPRDSAHVAKLKEAPLRIGWVSRWEFDKRPDRFLEVLRQLESRQVSFQLVLLGARSADEPVLSEIQQDFHDRILINEYASSRAQYISSLQQIDVVVSTADHEFFGIAVCEAIACGAAPVMPDRLSYRELLPDSRRYETEEDAIDMIVQLQDEKSRTRSAKTAVESIKRYQSTAISGQIDAAIAELHTRLIDS